MAGLRLPHRRRWVPAWPAAPERGQGGDPRMNTGKGRDESLRELAIQWLAEGDSHVKVLTTVLDEFARLHGIAVTAEQDTARMSAQIQATEQETQRLREGVGRLRAENARCMKEREDIAA